jgi:hypothetical protein
MPRMHEARFSFLLLLLLAAGLGNVGCATIRVTDPPRTATEQYLISQAASQAVSQIATSALRDRLVFIDTANFLPPDHALDLTEGRTQLIILDRQYLVGELRAHLLLNGVRLSERRPEAEIVLEVRSPGIGIDRSDYLFGIPPVLIPVTDFGAADIGGGGTIVSPEIAFLKNIRQHGYAGVAYIAYWRDTGEVVASSGPFTGRTSRVDWWYFGVGPRTSGDIVPVEQQE